MADHRQPRKMSAGCRRLLQRILVAAGLAAAFAPATLPGAARAAEQSAVLTQAEKALDCRRMAGRMQIRILELRGNGTNAAGSSIATGLQSAVVPLFGGPERGRAAGGEASRDIAKLRAMNSELMQRKCPHYDLEAELAKDKSAPGPRLTLGKTGRKP